MRTMWKIFPGTWRMKLFKLFSAFMFSMLNELVLTKTRADAGMVLVTDAIVTFVDR